MLTLLKLGLMLLAVKGGVNLTLEPSVQTVTTGTVVTVELVATVGQCNRSIGAIEWLIYSGPGLELLSAESGCDEAWSAFGFLPDPDGINDDLTDGLVLLTGLATPGQAYWVSGEVVVARLYFEVLGGDKVQILSRTVGEFGKTRVLAFYTPNVEITGAIGPTIAIHTIGGSRLEREPKRCECCGRAVRGQR